MHVATHVFSSDIWKRYDGYNCYNGWGATEVTGFLNIVTLEECKAECSKYGDCAAVIFNIAGGRECKLRKDVELSKCATGYDTLAMFLKTGVQIKEIKFQDLIHQDK